jgi:hypothetical protein
MSLMLVCALMRGIHQSSSYVSNVYVVPRALRTFSSPILAQILTVYLLCR